MHLAASLCYVAQAEMIAGCSWLWKGRH